MSIPLEKISPKFALLQADLARCKNREEGEIVVKELGNFNGKYSGIANEIKEYIKKRNVSRELNTLYDKQKWDPEDVENFGKLRKEKYGDNRIANSSSEFYEIWKQHTRSISKPVRSWKECNIKFHKEGFESLENDGTFEGIEPPFTPYHMDLVDIDIDYIVGVKGKFKRNNQIFYLCMGQYGGMRLFTDGPNLKSFNKLKFDDRDYTIDLILKDSKDIKCSGKRKVIHIYQDESC